MMKSRLLGGVIMEAAGKQAQQIKEESHSPSSNSPRSRTTPTPPIVGGGGAVHPHPHPHPQLLLPSGKENRMSGAGSGNSNGRSGCSSPATMTPGSGGTSTPNLNNNNITNSPGIGGSFHQAGSAGQPQPQLGLTNTEILTRSRSKGMHKDGNSHSHTRGERERSSDRSRSPKGHSRHQSQRDRPTDRDRSLSPLGPVITSQTSINLSIPRSSSTPTYAHSQGHGHSHYSPHTGTPNGRRTPSPPQQQHHHQQSSSSSASSATRTPSSTNTTAVSVGASSSGSSSGGSVGNSRLLIKIKRFLGTLLQFGADISPEVGDRVRALVFSLVSGHVSIEEFHGGLQEVTSFPLRPFVLPFLRAHLPLLQREVGALARSSKAASTLVYIQTHESSIIDAAAGEPCDIFHSEASDLSLSGGSGSSSSSHNTNKRKAESLYENGDCSSDHPGYSSTPKRHHGGGGITGNSYYSSPPSSFFPELREYYAAAAVAASSAAYGALPLSLTSSSQNHAHHADRVGSSTPITNGLSTPKPAGEDEWKNIHTMLNCILSMVEKTKRALGILQSRASSDLGNGDAGAGSTWLRRPGGGGGTGVGGPFILDNSEELKRQVGEMMAQAFRATEDRVCEVKRRAEEAVQEVKRQALAELKRAVAAAESRACEAVAGERARLERVLLESRGLGGVGGGPSSISSSLTASTNSASSHPPLPPHPHPHPPPPAQSEAEACWNCGRKANETCSGCSTARYCSSFCQHKDWESHHAVCKASIVNSSTGSGAGNRSTSPGNNEGRHSHPSAMEGSIRSPRSTTSNHSN